MGSSKTMSDATRSQRARRGSAAPVLPGPAGVRAEPATPELITGPTREELIRRRAYERYEREGFVDGHALEHWLAAEAEVSGMVLEGATSPVAPA